MCMCHPRQVMAAHTESHPSCSLHHCTCMRHRHPSQRLHASVLVGAVVKGGCRVLHGPLATGSHMLPSTGEERPCNGVALTALHLLIYVFDGTTHLGNSFCWKVVRVSTLRLQLAQKVIPGKRCSNLPAPPPAPLSHAGGTSAGL